MIDLVWILDSEKSASFGDKGISSSYIIPKNDMKVEPQTMAGSRLWVVLRGQEDRILKLVKIKKVERIIDGYHTGDLLVSSELAESFKLVPCYSEAAKYRTLDTRDLSLGISELKLETSKSLRLFVKGMVQVKLTPPPEKLLHQPELQLLPSSSRQLARNALRAIASRLNLEQIWASGTGEKLGAFSNFAYALISGKTRALQESDLIRELKQLDPISILLRQEEPKAQNDPPCKKKLPCIDIEFTEIEPDKIYAREFLCIDSKLKDLEEALNKTEHAEKIHQEMLKDTSIFLINQGITPYESGSIDLIYNAGNGLNVLEIKSANINNILTQAAKGAFQLACYQNVLSGNYDNVSTKLVLHETGDRELEKYAAQILSRLNISVLFYDPRKPWPMRIQGLPLC
jgi:hypothetical protein